VVTVTQPLPLPQGVSNLALSGNGAGSGFGFGGLGMMGTGGGGGGTGEGTIGLGAVGTIGHGGGGAGPQGSSYGYGVMPYVIAAKGGLSKDLIQDVITQHKNEIRGCYQKALHEDKDAGGRVVVRFVIDAATGKVVSVSIGESDLDDELLEACIAVKVKKWTFPSVKGGDKIAVNYPFLLKLADEEESPGP
jgi:hypothetical protein